MANNSLNARRKRAREFVFRRDGNKCVLCGATENLTIDHIHPLSEGGLDQHSNMQTLCLTCNRKKGSKVKLPFWQHLKRIWNINDLFQEWKHQLIFVVYTSSNSVYQKTKKQIEETNKRIDLIGEPAIARIDEFNKKFELWKVGHDNRIGLITKQAEENEEEIKKLKASIEEKEHVIRMLVDYLDVEYIPAKGERVAYFHKH